MLTGKRAFDGEDVADTLAAVLEPSRTGRRCRRSAAASSHAAARCLEKDRRERIADISAALFVLRASGEPSRRQSSGIRQRRCHADRCGDASRHYSRCAGGRRRSRARWSGSLTRPAPPSVVRTTITTSGSTALTLAGHRSRRRHHARRFTRRLSRQQPAAGTCAQPTRAHGAERSWRCPQGVFISPDGQWVGFFDGTALKKVAITGGPPVTVCAIQGAPRGATWGDGRDHHLRDEHTGDRPAARVRGRRRAHRAHEARSRARGRRSPVARVPAWRRGGPLHDYSGQRQHRERADRGAGSADRHVEGAHPWRQPRALRADGASGLRRRRDVARRGIRPRTAGGGRDACAGARGRGDDRHGRR